MDNLKKKSTDLSVEQEPLRLMRVYYHRHRSPSLKNNTGQGYKHEQLEHIQLFTQLKP